jgi:putative ATP-binding cassette transporter
MIFHLFIDLVRRESRQPLLPLLLVAGLAGLANALLLAIVNTSAYTALLPSANTRYFVLFLLMLLLYALAQRFVMVRSSEVLEEVLNSLRLRLLEKLRRADLVAVESFGQAVIFSSITKDTATLSQVGFTLIASFQSAVMLVFTLAYLMILSPLAFWITALISGAGALVYLRIAPAVRSEIAAAMEHENRLFDSLRHLLDGLKEVKLHRGRAAGLHRHFTSVSQTVGRIKTQAMDQYAAQYIFSQAALFLLIAGVVFLLPRLSLVPASTITRGTATILFLFGPLSALVGSLPMLEAGNVAVTSVLNLEQKLDFYIDAASASPAAPVSPPAPFRSLELRNVVFEYSDYAQAKTFSLGPVDLTIEAGEVIFLVGGNGSGKSTLLKVLTSLYTPQTGLLLYNGSPLRSGDYEWYRNLFSTVFSDYHLFDRLYGLEDTTAERIEDLIAYFRLAGHVRLAGDALNSGDLSSGQKKRLALLTSLLEDRPILVLDEWAADQDPQFRQFFYTSLLPALRAQGKTILAATHDDRYFHVADRVIKLEWGRLVETGDRERVEVA